MLHQQLAPAAQDKQVGDLAADAALAEAARTDEAPATLLTADTSDPRGSLHAWRLHSIQ
ncbi:MAG TPA: hypothetical protein VMW62_13215 [Chloroflexota bacterium]|nr:hypothetical protein [Chloroflexota bacterium]